MKNLSFMALALTLATSVAHASPQPDPTPRPTPKLVPVDCTISDEHATEFGTDVKFTVELTDHELVQMNKYIISKRVPVPKHPGYFIDVTSNPNVVHLTSGLQGISIDIKSTKYLKLSERYSGILGDGRVDLEVTFPKESYSSVNVSCEQRDFLDVSIPKATPQPSPAPEPTPIQPPKLASVVCTITDLHATEFGTNIDFTVELTDHELAKEIGNDSKYIISKRVPVPKHPGYFVDVSSNPAILDPDNGPQNIDVDIKSKKYIGLSERYLGSIAPGESSIDVTFPNEEYASINVSCGQSNLLP